LVVSKPPACVVTAGNGSRPNVTGSDASGTGGISVSAIAVRKNEAKSGV